MSAQDKLTILVIGATGAQGVAVIGALLSSRPNGSPSPYSIRALTRNATSARARSLQEKGVELVQGSFLDFPVVLKALTGVYGVWVVIDGFTVPADQEIYAGIRIYELASQAGAKHFIWSSLEYIFKQTNWNPEYRVDHYDAKGRVNEFLKSQPSAKGGDGLTWSIITTGPYMDMLKIYMLGPLNKRADGTYVFASPIQDGHMPMISLADIGFFARYAFDNRALVSGQDLQIASQVVGWDELVATFQHVTGKKAVYLPQSLDKWFENFRYPDRKTALQGKDDSLTWRENFSNWWKLFRDDIIKRDMEWIRSVNPKTHTLESWMKANDYTGDESLNIEAKGGATVLKLVEDAQVYGSGTNPDVTSTL